MSIENSQPEKGSRIFRGTRAARIARKLLKDPIPRTEAITTSSDGSTMPDENPVINLNSEKAKALMYRIDVDIAKKGEIGWELEKEIPGIIATFPPDLKQSVLTYLDFQRFRDKPNTSEKGKWVLPDLSAVDAPPTNKGRHLPLVDDEPPTHN